MTAPQRVPCRVCGGPSWQARCQRCAVEAHRAAQAAVDEVVVERLVAGDPPAWSSRAERQEAVRRLTELGLFAWVIAERLHISERSVVRLRSREARGGAVAA